MATLQVISYSGDGFEYSLNREASGKANVNSIRAYLEGQLGGKLDWSTNQIRFTRGSDFFEWRGSFRFSSNGELLDGSRVTEFERELGGTRYGRILISGISYDATIEAGAFYSLTVPNEIRDVLERANTSSYGAPALQSQAYPGFTYSFSTAYDGSARSDSQQPVTKSERILISAPVAYDIQNADTITNYNPIADRPIQIDLSSFSGATGNLKIAKKTKQLTKLAKTDIDFIFDQRVGYLYYNENGKEPGFGDGGIFAILEGKPKAGLGDFEFS